MWKRHAVNKSWKPGHVDGHVKHDGMRGHSVAQSQPHFTITSTCTFQVTNRHSSQSTKHKHKAESTQSTKHKAQHAKHTAQSTKCQAQSTQPKAQSTCTKHREQSTKHMHKQECMACKCSSSPSKPFQALGLVMSIMAQPLPKPPVRVGELILNCYCLEPDYV